MPPPPLLLHGLREVIIPAVIPRYHPTELREEGDAEGRGRRGMDVGGCHGNWESFALRHHLLLHGAERAHEYLSFMDTDRRVTQTELCGLPLPSQMERGVEGSSGWMNRWMDVRRGHKGRLTDLNFYLGQRVWLSGFSNKERTKMDVVTMIEIKIMGKHWKNLTKWIRFVCC